MLKVAVDDGFSAFRDAVVVLVQPFDQAAAFFGRQDQDVVFADRVTRLDRHATSAPTLLEFAPGSRRGCIVTGLQRVLVTQAGILVVILDKSRCRVCIKMIDECLVGNVDLFALDERRYRDDDSKVLDVTLKVVCHGDDGSIAVANEDDL